MSSVFTVCWAPAAERDLREIILFIADNNPDNARRVLERLQELAGDLSLFPERGRIVPELRCQNIYSYREIVVSPWRMIYRLAENRVDVLAVIDSRRNVEDLILDRLLRSR